MTEPEDVTEQQAEALATHAIQESKPDANFVLLKEQTTERSFGWVFFFSPRRYLETHDPGTLVPGAGPVAVLRNGGKTHFLPTSVPPAIAIQQFESNWRAGSTR